MKSKLRNLLLAAMALMLFAGCSNLALNDASYEGSDAGDKCVLTIGIDGFSGVKSEKGRYIAPDKYTASENHTTWKIEGTSSRGLVLNIDDEESTTLDPIDLKSGSKEIALEYDVWYLKLHAYDDDKEVLQGVTTVDLTKGAPEEGIKFVLSTKGVTTNGGLKLTVKGTNSAVKSYYAGLYDINTDTLVTPLADSDYVELSDPNDENSPKISKAPADIIIETEEEIAPGSYIFKFIPYNDVKANAREDLTPWSDVITIAPGRTVEKEITITIMQAPSKPEGFTVSLVDASEEDGDDYYTVRLNWTDTSSNEENFVLRIYEAATTEEAASMDKILENEPVVFDKNFYANNSYWVSGTLGMSTTTCDVRLPTGHLYEFTLTAKNRAGQSEVCKREGVESGDFVIEKGPDDAKKYVTVNRQKITYNLMGGTRTVGTNKEDGSGEEIVTSDLNKVVYRTYDGTAYTLMTIAGTDYALDDTSTPDVNEATNTDKLIYNDHPWNEWKSLPNDGEKITKITGFEDTMVYASYNTNVNVAYEIADEYKTLDVGTADGKILSSNNSFATIVGNTLTMITTKEEGGKTVSSGVTGGTITFTIKGEKKQKVDEHGDPVLDEHDNPVIETKIWTSCDKIILLINGSVAGARDNALSYEYSLNNFKTSGIYNISVIAEVDGNYYSCNTIPLTVDIKAKAD